MDRENTSDHLISIVTQLHVIFYPDDVMSCNWCDVLSEGVGAFQQGTKVIYDH